MTIGGGLRRWVLVSRLLAQTLSTDLERSRVSHNRQPITLVFKKDPPIGDGEDLRRGVDGFIGAAQQPPHEVVDGCAVQRVVAHESFALTAAQLAKKRVRVDWHGCAPSRGLTGGFVQYGHLHPLSTEEPSS